MIGEKIENMISNGCQVSIPMIMSPKHRNLFILIQIPGRWTTKVLNFINEETDIQVGELKLKTRCKAFFKTNFLL